MTKKFDVCKSVYFRVEAIPAGGADLKVAAKECIDFAKATKCNVHMQFNCVGLTIRPFSKVENIERLYHEGLDKFFSKEEKNA